MAHVTPEPISATPAQVGPNASRIHSVDMLQRGLDSAVGLIAARQEVLRHIDEHGRCGLSGVEVFAGGVSNMRREVQRVADHSNELLAVQPQLTKISEASTAFDRAVVLRGGRLRSIFNYDSIPSHGLPTAARSYFSDEVLGRNILAAPAPMQMIINSRSSVTLEGPEIHGERSIIVVSRTDLLRPAFGYWQAQLSLAVPVHNMVGNDPLATLTPRQQQIATMLADDLTDASIAARLDVSLRTVQAEVAAILRLLDVRSRFGAGMRLGRLGYEHLVDRHE